MNSAERLKATYNFQPVDHLYRREFYIWNALSAIALIIAISPLSP
jgi:hypothetical protein